jgi:hypothetical protein
MSSSTVSARRGLYWLWHYPLLIPEKLLFYDPTVSLRPTYTSFLSDNPECVNENETPVVLISELLPWKWGSGRGRNAGYPAPPAQIPACATNALGSCLR